MRAAPLRLGVRTAWGLCGLGLWGVVVAGFVAGFVVGCVDKAPPPLWPAPPPPAVAELLGEPDKKPGPLPSAVVGAPVLAGPPSKLDKLPVDKSSILDPEGAAATAAAQADPPSSPRPVPTHR